MFHTADDRQIKNGEVTDVYFQRVAAALVQAGIDKVVTAEVRAASLPEGRPWAIFCGAHELRELFRGLPVVLKTLPEGSVFKPEEPVVSISGRYLDFAVFETALLGLVCQASGIATKAARCKLAAMGRPVLSFGARRMHPAIAPMIERSAFIGGCDGVAAVVGGELIDKEPVGTMSHSLMLAVESDVEAYKLFDQAIPAAVPRVALIDTFADEKFGAVIAAETLGDKLAAVRLDTPRSRRGDFQKILREVRWELDLRGYSHVKLFVSGGLDEDRIKELNDSADAYGVGTAIANAPVIDFSMDIVAVDGRPLAKRGKMSGIKDIVRCRVCRERFVVPAGCVNCPDCAGPVDLLLIDQVMEGQVLVEEKVDEIRERALAELRDLHQ